jgi:uncharacterized protein (TIGR01777 family)
MRVIVTGGTGLIGRPLCAALAADGDEVIVLSRNPAKVKGLAQGVKVEQWDGKTAQGWGQLADGAGAIVNLAGEGIADGRWSTSRKQRIRDSRIEAGKAVMQAIAAASVKPKVLIQASAVGIYGPRTDEIITEQTSPGKDFLAQVCFDWEASTASAQSKFGVRRAIARTGIVLSLDGGAFPQMALPFKLFAGGPVGSGKQYVPWIHMADEVRAIQFLIRNEKAEGAFNLSAPNPLTSKEFGKVLGQVLGRPSIMPAPAFALRAIFGEMAALLLSGQRQVPARLLELGFEFTYPQLEAALRNLYGK